MPSFALTQRISLRTLTLAALALTAVKIWLATRLDLYSDEVFYWWEASRPALAYSDLPFMTAQLVNLGTAILGDSTLGVRLLFLLLGSSLPFLVYWLAHPVVGKEKSLSAAALVFCLPLGSFLGLLAVPDVPMILLGLLAIGSFDRAIRLNRPTWWLATGVFVGLGFCTHYRFILFPAGALIFLLATGPGQQLCRSPWLWLTLAISLLGLIPTLQFNLQHAMGSASFYFVDRHPWQFNAAGLRQPLIQALIVTPLLYGALVYTAVLLLRQGAKRPPLASLLLFTAGLHLLVYAVLAPWADATSTTEHWPLPGYIVLLIFLPDSLQQLYQSISRSRGSTSARRAVAAIPITGLLGSAIALAGISSQAFLENLAPLVQQGLTSNKMAGWKEFTSHTREVSETYFSSEPVFVTDNYYTAAYLEFDDSGRQTFSLDEDKAVRDGRRLQLALWQKDADALASRIRNEVLLITEDSELNVVEKREFMALACGYLDEPRPLPGLSLFQGDKRFSFYAARVSRAPPGTTTGACPYPAFVWLDSPANNALTRDRLNIEGWAYKEDIGIAQIRAVLDGGRKVTIPYGIARPDVVEANGISTDPNIPYLGFKFSLDTSDITPGRHFLQIETVSNDDEEESSPRTWFTVER